MPRARRALVVALVVALYPRASSARAISREDAFVGYSERARGATLRLTLDGDGAGDARAIALRLREDWAPTLARELAGGAARRGSFYRAEATPEAGARDGYGGPGPPYALLQGALEGLRGTSGGRGADRGARVRVRDRVGAGFLHRDERTRGVGTSARVLRGGGRDVDGARGRDHGDVRGASGDVGTDECDGVEREIAVFGVD